MRTSWVHSSATEEESNGANCEAHIYSKHANYRICVFHSELGMVSSLLLFRGQPQIEKHDRDSDLRDRAHRHLLSLYAELECVQDWASHSPYRQVRRTATTRNFPLVFRHDQQLAIPQHHVLLQLLPTFSDHRQFHGPQSIRELLRRRGW